MNTNMFQHESMRPLARAFNEWRDRLTNYHSAVQELELIADKTSEEFLNACDRCDYLQDNVDNAHDILVYIMSRIDRALTD